MTERLFLGGPRDGRWINIDEGYWSHVVLLPRKASFWSSSEGTTFEDPETATYRRRKAVVPGWRIPLVFFVYGGLDPFTHAGFVLPGFVVGERLLSSVLCSSCRAHRGSYYDGLCVECYLEQGGTS